MKKRLDIEMISNELSGASLFFQRSPLEGSGVSAAGTENAPKLRAETDDQRTAEDARLAGVPSARTGGCRRLTRTPFEFYQDQLERLRELSLAAKLRGEKGSMSAMVREAVDRYLVEGEEELPTG